MLEEIRFALRVIRSKPGFALLVVITLGLGIAINTSIFSIADAFLFKPLPFPDLDSLVAVLEKSPGSLDWSDVSPANFHDWRERAQSFSGITAWNWYDLNLTGVGEPEKLQGHQVLANFFDVLGVRLVKGRGFATGEDQAGHDNVAVLGYQLWRNRFAGDPAILGKIVRLDGKPYEVIGVAPEHFRFPLVGDVWIPLGLTPEEWKVRDRRGLQAAARLKPGVDRRVAAAEMDALAAQLAREHPATGQGWGARVMPIRDYEFGDLTRRYTVVLMFAVAFVLLIACANVANLQFARATGRLREMAVRAALGATRWHAIRQLLTESTVLALAASLLGLLLAAWGIDLILRYMPPEVARYLPTWHTVRLDQRAFWFTVAISLAAGLLSGIAPAIASANPDLQSALREGGRGSSGSRRRRRVRAILVAGEIAAALVLLVGAGLMTRGLSALVNANVGFEPEHVLTARVNLPGLRYPNETSRRVFFDRLLRRFEGLEGIDSVAITTSPPYSNGESFGEITIEGQPAQPGERRFVQFQTTSPSYFRHLRVPIVAGRDLAEADGPDAPAVCVISESLAKRYWPGRSPLGARVRTGNNEDKESPWMTIIGVASDVRYQWEAREVVPALYRPYRQRPRQIATISARVPSGDPRRLAPALRRQVAAVDPDLPIYEVAALDDVIYRSLVGLSYVAATLVIAGIIGIVMAAVGIYGLMAYSVSERTQEIGIRMALGASREQVLGMVARDGLLLTGSGLAIGISISLLVAKGLSSLVFGVSAIDPVTFGGTLAVLGAAAMLACWLPARRATRVDPIEALK